MQCRRSVFELAAADAAMAMTNWRRRVNAVPRSSNWVI